MEDFPEFMKNPVNRVATSSQYTPGIEGYVYDGADGSQMAYWTYTQTAKSEPHAHEYDEYLVVVQGNYTVVLQGEEVCLMPGDEYLIKRGVVHGGYAEAGTRVIYAFEEKRVEREHT